MKTLNQNKNYSLFSNIKYLINKIWSWDKTLFIIFGLFTVCKAISPFIHIYASKFILNELTGLARKDLLLYVLTFVLIFSGIINFLVQYLEHASIPRMINIRLSFTRILRKKALNMDFKHTEDPEMLNKYQTGIRALSSNTNGIQGIIHKLFSVLSSFIAFFGFSAIIWTLHPLIVFLLIFNVSITYFFTLSAKKYEYLQKDTISKLNRQSTYLTETMSDFSYGKEIRLYNLNLWLSSKFNEIKAVLVSTQKKIRSKYLKSESLDLMLLFFREGLIYIYLIFSVINKGMRIGDFMLYFLAVTSFTNWMELLLKDIVHMHTQNFHVNDYRNFLAMEDNDSNSNLNNNSIKGPIKIEFKNVSFKYPKSTKYIFEDLSFNISPGERLAIVGINGAGKTTLIKLLVGLYKPTSGTILINDIDISTISKEEYYKIFSTVFQEIKTFAFTVCENVALSNKTDISVDKVHDSLKKSQLFEKISTLENGIDTSVLKILDSHGVDFSGGENQKLAIARALYKDSPVMILDEPTSALDPLSEYEIYTNFDKLISDKTAIYISHRLSSTRFCDRIFYMENGKILESGTHTNLMDKNGKYREMFDIQSQYYKTDGTLEVI